MNTTYLNCNDCDSRSLRETSWENKTKSICMAGCQERWVWKSPFIENLCFCSQWGQKGFLHIHETYNVCPKQQFCGMAVTGSRKTNWLTDCLWIRTLEDDSDGIQQSRQSWKRPWAALWSHTLFVHPIKKQEAAILPMWEQHNMDVDRLCECRSNIERLGCIVCNNHASEPDGENRNSSDQKRLWY